MLLTGLLALFLAACSGDEPAAESTSTTTASTSTSANGSSDSTLIAIMAGELEEGLIDPLPMDRATARCTAEGVIGEMGVEEGQSLEEYLGTRNEGEIAENVLMEYFDCSDARQVGDALAADLVETIGFPAEDEIKNCLSQRLDSVDEVRGLVGLAEGAAQAMDVLEGCVGLGDVMTVDISDLTEQQRACLNENGDDVLAAMMTPGEGESDATRNALRSVLENCGLDPGSVPE